jgi:cytosine/uracil/thiamine/allantoin permease
MKMKFDWYNVFDAFLLAACILSALAVIVMVAITNNPLWMFGWIVSALLGALCYGMMRR